MSCAADILAAMDITKPADESEIAAFLQALSAGVAQVVIDYLLASVTSACTYTGTATGTGAGAFSALTASLFITEFESGLMAEEDVNNAFAQGFATGLQELIGGGTITETVAGTLGGNPISFTAVGSSHTAPAPSHTACAAALERMSTEKPDEEDDMAEVEQEKLKLLANSLAKLIDDILPTVVVATVGQAPGAGSTGSGAVTASIPAVDSSFPA